MSEEDGFVREVTEDVQRDRLLGFFHKYGLWLGLSAAVVVLGVSGYAYWSYTQQQDAQNFGAQLSAITSIKDEKEREQAYISLAKENHKQERAVLPFISAHAPADITPVIDDPLYKDAIILSQAYHQIDTITLQEATDTLTPLTEEGRPFRLAAMELLASVHIGEDNTEEAVELYKKIAATPSTPPGMRSRATYMQQIYADTAIQTATTVSDDTQSDIKSEEAK